METNPYVPRQRNRRAERSAEAPAPQPVQAQPVASPAPQQAYAPQQVYAPQPVYPPVQQSAPMTVPQQGQQPIPQRPVQTLYPPVQSAPYAARPVVQQPPQRPAVQPAQPVRQQPAQRVEYAPRSTPVRPRTAEPSGSANPSWQTPAAPIRRADAPVPHARQGNGLAREQAKAERQRQREEDLKRQREEDRKRRREEERTRSAEAPRPAARKLSPLLTTVMSLMLIAVMALVAAWSLMEAYLTTQAEQQEAAYQAILSNYHVTEDESGVRSVTWQALIEKYATQYNLQPAFVTAIIRNESSFRTNAESNVGARGLMQIMPDTAEWIAGKLDDSAYSFDRMWDAETNIRYGCWYLGYLSELFDGDPILVACAYHAGQGEVRSWLGDKSISSDGATVPIENIPISETKTYAGRVTQAYGIYQALLYPDQPFDAQGRLSDDGAVRAAAADR